MATTLALAKSGVRARADSTRHVRAAGCHADEAGTGAKRRFSGEPDSPAHAQVAADDEQMTEVALVRITAATRQECLALRALTHAPGPGGDTRIDGRRHAEFAEAQEAGAFRPRAGEQSGLQPDERHG
jgi:hypothetical protein